MNAPKIIKTETLHSGKFLRLELVTYQDRFGQVNTWETVQRNNTPSAAVIIAHTKPEGHLVLVKQFRPAVGTMELAFPAGLIDPGETPENTAYRELREETGFIGTIDYIAPGVAASGGLTGENLVPVIMSIDSKLPENQNPQTDFQDVEDIETILVPMDQLGDFLKQEEQKGTKLDSRLVFWTLAQGIRI